MIIWFQANLAIHFFKIKKLKRLKTKNKCKIKIFFNMFFNVILCIRMCVFGWLDLRKV
jgi:hypothetical protein